MSGCRLALAVALVWGVGWGGAARADSLSEQMTKGKVEADLGHADAAAAVFAAVAKNPAASASLQAEALVRLGAARQAKGDAKGSVAAFERVMKEHAGDEAAIRLLIQAAGGALPGKERWTQAWRQVQLGIDLTDREHPTPWIRWPEAPWNWRRLLVVDDKAKVVPFTIGTMRYTGLPIKLDYEDADLQSVFRFFADLSGLNVVVNPGIHGAVSFKGIEVNWDDALDRILSACGYWYDLNENVVHIAPVDQLLAEPPRTFTGKPIDLDFHERDLRDSLGWIAGHGNVKVGFGPGVAGQLTLKLNGVHWDQAFDVVARVNALRWKRTGDTIFVGRPEEVAAR